MHALIPEKGLMSYIVVSSWPSLIQVLLQSIPYPCSPNISFKPLVLTVCSMEANLHLCTTVENEVADNAAATADPFSFKYPPQINWVKMTALSPIMSPSSSDEDGTVPRQALPMPSYRKPQI